MGFAQYVHDSENEENTDSDNENEYRDREQEESRSENNENYGSTNGYWFENDYTGGYAFYSYDDGMIYNDGEGGHFYNGEPV